MIEMLRAVERLFSAHAPETLMALFGAVTSLWLLYLIWTLLRQLFGLQTRTANIEATQDLATAALIEALVRALVTESNHLRATLDGILEEALRRSERNAELLGALMTQTADTPERTLDLLRPEFDHLRRELRQAEVRIISKITLQHGEGQGGEAKTDPDYLPDVNA